jgi:hypothetical protein
MLESSDGGAKSTLYCSFCGKSQHEVRKLIAGPNVFICNECVELCADIIKEEDRKTRKASGPAVMSPSEIKGVLDDYVIGQEQAKRVLSVAVHNHYKRLAHGSKGGEVELGEVAACVIESTLHPRERAPREQVADPLPPLEPSATEPVDGRLGVVPPAALEVGVDQGEMHVPTPAHEVLARWQQPRRLLRQPDRPGPPLGAEVMKIEHRLDRVDDRCRVLRCTCYPECQTVMLQPGLDIAVPRERPAERDAPDDLRERFGAVPGRGERRSADRNGGGGIAIDQEQLQACAPAQRARLVR